MGTHRTVVCLATATFSLAILSGLLLGLLIWQSFFNGYSYSEGPLDTTNTSAIRETFPGYFRTPQEQKEFESVRIIRPSRVANTSRIHRRCFNSTSCYFRGFVKPISGSTTLATIINSPAQSGKRRRAAILSGLVSECFLDNLQTSELTFHACCISYSEWKNVSSLPTAEPNQSGYVQIAQFPGFNQYFEIQECCQARDCTGCQCAQTYYKVSAVVAKRHNTRTRYVTEAVNVPGCCKCLNAFPISTP